MNKIAIIYSFRANKSSQIAKKIVEQFGNDIIDEIDAESISEDQFMAYSNIICGVPTWFDGSLPNYWDEFVPALEEMELKGKKIAYYGLGDQKGYPENFVDAIGILAEVMEAGGAQTVGMTSVDGYWFVRSKAVRDDQFVGLAIDVENQSDKTPERISEWVARLKTAFDL
jgi:flavodoxin I